MSDDTDFQYEPQVTNQNNLSPNKFIIVMNKFPNVNFFAQRVNIPDITIGTTPFYNNRSVDSTIVGDKIVFGDLMISFILDEDLAAYEELYNWILQAGDSELEKPFSDISVATLTNNSNKNKTFSFYNTFPYNVGNILLDTTQSEDQPLTIDVQFKFTHFLIK